ncbi:MAG: T9SS type A sorting domain-containing protein [Bacteroidaceae bacterium]|nr:T9SS type A sorting domain-containing protein [Bacteroidaceae bacterium]
MKAKILMAALLLMAGTSMMADNFQYLTLTYGNSEHNISLPLVQRISFEENYVVVTTTEGTHRYPITLLDKITFTESATAIEALPEQLENLTFKDGTLAVKGDGLLRVYGANGALLSIANVKEGANISLDNLPAGVYIIRMGDKTIKVRK